MYAWLWRKLPFGLPGKLIGALGLAVATVALLWYVVFPWAEPILPFDDVQVGTDGGVPADDVAPPPTPSPGETQHPGDDYDVPYDPESNNPVPSASR